MSKTCAFVSQTYVSDDPCENRRIGSKDEVHSCDGHRSCGRQPLQVPQWGMDSVRESGTAAPVQALHTHGLPGDRSPVDETDRLFSKTKAHQS